MRECETMIVKRGDIYYADLRPVIGSEQGGVRPVLIIQMIWATVIARRLFVRQLQASCTRQNCQRM